MENQREQHTFCKLSSVSLPRPRNLFSSSSTDGGERNKKRALRSVRLTCLTPYIYSQSVVIPPETISSNGNSYLHFNIQNADPAFLCDDLHRLNAGTVVVSSELGMFNKSILVHKIHELLLGDKVVFTAIFFTRSRSPSSVWQILKGALVG